MGAAVAEERREAIHEVFKSPEVSKPAKEPAVLTAIAPPQALATDAAENSTTADQLRIGVLTALSDAGHRMLVTMLEGGEWKVEGNELTIKVAASAAVIDMSLGADARKLAIASASSALGRLIKLKVISGAVSQPVTPNAGATNGNGRSRAEQDPIVRRMKEAFGAEIRTIIDYREKR
ncbi:MAG: hypothetical protein ACHP8A_10520 [Terriglobales bacterium]